jgi:hypothetical protein
LKLRRRIGRWHSDEAKSVAGIISPKSALLVAFVRARAAWLDLKTNQDFKLALCLFLVVAVGLVLVLLVSL